MTIFLNLAFLSRITVFLLGVLLSIALVIIFIKVSYLSLAADSS